MDGLLRAMPLATTLWYRNSIEKARVDEKKGEEISEQIEYLLAFNIKIVSLVSLDLQDTFDDEAPDQRCDIAIEVQIGCPIGNVKETKFILFE